MTTVRTYVHGYEQSSGQRVHELAMQISQERKISYSDAVMAVLAEDGSLAKQYSEDTLMRAWRG